MNDEDVREAQDLFVVEARDLLGQLENGLLELGRGRVGADTINAIFRAVHTLKGSGGLFGLRDIVDFAHVVESVLDLVRDDHLPVTPDLLGVLLPCHDHLADLVAAVEQGQPTDIAPPGGVLERLHAYLDPATSPAAPDTAAAQTDTSTPEAGLLRLRLGFGPDCLRGGMDPLPLLAYVATLGDVVSASTAWNHLPDIADFDPEACYLQTEIVLATTQTPESVRSVFDFVADESTIDIEIVGTTAATPPPARLEASTPSRSVELDQPSAGGATVRQAPRATEAATLRVDAARLDTLVDTVGELVIAGAAASLRAAGGDEQLRNAVDDVVRLIEAVRDDALGLRMVPIGATFNRFHRVVREVSATLGKSVDLVVTGGDTEVDKTLAEQIGDPLTHLVRNALDHGIEPPEERAARGKPAVATLHMDARHDSGSIVVTITDDGTGIDRAKVLTKAVERGLVDPAATLTDAEVLRLVFEPGFSTAAQVSDLSGRGVGMDVVKRNVSALRGSIDVTSTPGAGTTMTIRLPLTLAIIDGFMVGVDDATVVVPLDRVSECLELPAEGRHRDYIALRGEILPLIRSRTLLSLDTPVPRRQSVVVVESHGVRAGLVVDTLRGEFQTVIKPLGDVFAQAEFIGGATILGNGEVALILDVPRLLDDARSGGCERRQVPAPASA